MSSSFQDLEAQMRKKQYEKVEKGILNRVDTWLVKGFSGITNALTERASYGEYNEEIVKALDSAMELMKRCINCNQANVGKDVNKMLIFGITSLSKILYKRCYDLGIDSLSKWDQEILKEYLDKLQIVKDLFHVGSRKD